MKKYFNYFWSNISFKEPETWCGFIVIILVIKLTIFSLSPNSFQELKILAPSLIPSLAILTSALCASAFARKNIKESRELNRTQETIRFISSLEESSSYIAAKEAYAKYQFQGNEEKLLFLIVNRLSDEYKLDISYEELLKVQAYYNYFELISLSIEKNIVDEQLYKEWHKSQLIAVWNKSVKIINVLRCMNGNKNLFIKWENMAQKWAMQENTKIDTPTILNKSDLEKKYCNEEMRKKFSDTLQDTKIPTKS